MKKHIIILIIICLLLSITSCKKNDRVNESNFNKKKDNVVVIYFSVTENTEKVANDISEIGGFDIIRIYPNEGYTSFDIDYNDKESRVIKEKNDKKIRPEMASEILLDKYDTIYLGYPIWFDDAPNIIYTFLDTHDLTNKNIYLFSTSKESDITNSSNNIIAYNNKLNIKGSMGFNSSSSYDDIKRWVNATEETRNEYSVTITINDKPYLLSLEDNDISYEVINYLNDEYTMKDLNHNEKYVYFDRIFNTSEKVVETIYKGDVYLYNNNCLVIFYENTSNLYSYTKIGHINDLNDMPSGDIKISIKK